MPLPHGEHADVPITKVQEYLLAETHPVGWAKARFFKTLGFREDAPEALQAALLQIARTGVLIEEQQSRFGSKYVVDGYITGPELASTQVRTVWILEPGSARPRFVTAYPAPGLRRDP